MHVHSFSKETQHFRSCLSFVEECIPVNLGLYMPISHDPGSQDIDPGPQEKSTKKSCVSFETECNNTMWESILGPISDFLVPKGCINF